MPNNIDRLFALKALEQAISDERKLVEGECRQELLEAYEADGTDRRTSTYFGPDAGKFSLKRTKGKKGGTVVEYNLADEEAFGDWLEEELKAALGFSMLNARELGRWWFEATGELPDGISRVEYAEEAEPDKLSAQIYSFKPDMVLGKLAEDGNFLEGANSFLLGDGE